MADQFLGEIRIVPFNFAPNGWATCDGQILAIAQNTALFSLLGTFYGGDGRSTFALPNLIGSAPVDAGDGPGLTSRSVGNIGGESAVILLTTQIPSHHHTLVGDTTAATSTSPTGNLVANPPAPPRTAKGQLYAPSAATTAMAMNGLRPTGGSQPHNNMQPYLVLTYIISLTGIFPARG